MLQIIPFYEPKYSPSLPSELYWSIISHVDERSDLATCSRVSQTFQTISEKYLYKAINCYGQFALAGTTLMSLIEAMRLPRIAPLVLDLRVGLTQHTVCAHLDEVMYDGKVINCGQVSRMLGDTIAALPNLEKLYTYCHLCEVDLYGHYGYLTRLQAKQLRSVCFACHCERNGATEFVDTTPLLTNPIINNLTELALVWPKSVNYSTLEETYFDGPNVFPNLTTFLYDGTEYANLIITKKPITRMQAFFKNDVYVEYNPGHQGELTHFFSNDVIYSLHSILDEGISAFRGLKAIGAFQFVDATIESIIAQMQDFTSLKQLELVEFLLEKGSTLAMPDFNWALPLLKQLEKQHPNLRWIITPRSHEKVKELWWSTTVWEKVKGSGWRERTVPFTSHLSMVNGDYEKQL